MGFSDGTEAALVGQLRDQGAAGCALTGNPNTYSRMGFVSDGNLHHKGTEDRHVQWRSLDGSSPKGWLVFDATFGD